MEEINKMATVTYLENFGKLESGVREDKNYCELKYGNEVIRGEGKTYEEAIKDFMKKAKDERNNLIKKASDLEYISGAMSLFTDSNKISDNIFNHFKNQTLRSKNKEGGN
jgi:hypothetical protein